MRLIDFFMKSNTNHFKLRIVHSAVRVLDVYYDSLDYNQQRELSNNEVISIDCTTEVEKETQITHTISIRPIIVVTIEGQGK